MSRMIVLAPLAFVAACASDPQPSVGGDVQVPPAAESTNPTLKIGYWYRPARCVDNSLMFLPVLSYSDGSSTENVVCQYHFADGSVEDGCGITHSVPDAAPVMMTARDTVTGATATFTETVQGPPSLSATLDVTTSADTLTWHAHTLFGETQDSGFVSTTVSISPAANVIVDDPTIFEQRDGTVHVTVDGTYTVQLQASVQFGEEGGCGTIATASIDVDCSGATPGN